MKTELFDTPKPRSVINQSGQSVGFQVNIAGDYVINHQPGTLSLLVSTAPSPPTTFIGRKKELETLNKYLIKDKPTRQIVLYGMGGVGKTAIALEIADRLKAKFPGGIFWAPLQDYEGNPRQILYRWGRVCVDELPAESDLNSLAEHVRNLLFARLVNAGAILVICDHIQRDWLGAFQILAKAIPTDVPLIATVQKRELSQAIGGELIRIDPFDQYEAIELFSTYVGQSAIDNERVTALNLLTNIGYHPLAVEVVGKRLKFQLQKPSYTIAKFQDALLKNIFEELKLPGTEGLVTIFFSIYKTLSISTQTLFRCLGVFVAGPINVTGVAVVANIDQTTVEAELDSLVASGLLEWGESQGDYTIHPLLRRYAQMLLEKSTDIELRRKNHLSYCLAFVKENAQLSAISHDRLEQMLPDLMTAINFARSNQLHAEIVEFADLLYTTSLFLEIRSYVNEAEQLLATAIASCQALNDRHRKGRHLSNLGNVYLDTGRIEQGFSYYHDALHCAHDVGDRQLEIDVLISLGRAHRIVGKPDGALDYFQKALVLANEIDDLRSQGILWGNLGNVHRGMPRSNRAIECYNRALAIARKVADRRSEGITLGNLASLFQVSGQLDDATDYFSQALSIAHEIGDNRDKGVWLGSLGDLCTEREQWKKAIDCYEQALALARRTTDIRREGIWLGSLGLVYEKQNDYTRAIEYYSSALMIAQNISDHSIKQVWLNNLGSIYCHIGKPKQALGCLEEAFELASLQKDSQAITNQLIRLGLAYKQAAQPEKAREFLTKALSALDTIEDPFGNVIRSWLADETPLSQQTTDK